MAESGKVTCSSYPSTSQNATLRSQFLLCSCPRVSFCVTVLLSFTLLKTTEAWGGDGKGTLTSRCLSGSRGARNPPRGPNPSMAPCTSSGAESTLRSWRWRTWRTGQVGPPCCVGFLLWWLCFLRSKASGVAAYELSSVASGLWSTESVVMAHTSLGAPWHGKSSRTRDPNQVPYIDSRVLNPWTLREAPALGF